MAELRATTEDGFDTDVLQASQPTLVDFWAEWCGPCKMMEPILAELAEAETERLQIIKVDVQEFPDLAMRFGVMNIPTMILFRGGEAQERLTGYMPLKVLREKLQSHL